MIPATWVLLWLFCAWTAATFIIGELCRRGVIGKRRG